MKKMVFLLSTALVLAACMSPPPRAGDHMVSNPQLFPEESEQLQALRDAGKSFTTIVTVPAAGNMLSNGMAIGALKMGSGSAPADSIFNILREGTEQTIAVVGKSDALTAATIEAAIRQLDGASTATTILFAGKSSYVKDLEELTSKAGVPFEGVAFPLAQEKDQPQETDQPQEKDQP